MGILVCLLRAIRTGQAVIADYQSMSRQPPSRQVLAPHAVPLTGSDGTCAPTASPARSSGTASSRGCCRSSWASPRLLPPPGIPRGATTSAWFWCRTPTVRVQAPTRGNGLWHGRRGSCCRVPSSAPPPFAEAPCVEPATGRLAHETGGAQKRGRTASAITANCRMSLTKA